MCLSRHIQHSARPSPIYTFLQIRHYVLRVRPHEHRQVSASRSVISIFEVKTGSRAKGNSLKIDWIMDHVTRAILCSSETKTLPSFASWFSSTVFFYSLSADLSSPHSVRVPRTQCSVYRSCRGIHFTVGSQTSFGDPQRQLSHIRLPGEVLPDHYRRIRNDELRCFDSYRLILDRTYPRCRSFALFLGRSADFLVRPYR